jgi:LPXTG-motif cell wall-anchored protein
VGLLTTPANAVDEIAIVTTAAVETTGVIRVENIVVNDNLGTKTFSDFEFTVKHFGTNVEGSPFNLTETSTKSFTLQPGTYVVSATSVDGYLGIWSGVGIVNGFINLKAGDDITITRNTYDIGIALPVYPTAEPTVDPVTEDGGVLPATSSNWFNALALGLLLSAAGALGFRKNSLN